MFCVNYDILCLGIFWQFFFSICREECVLKALKKGFYNNISWLESLMLNCLVWAKLSGYINKFHKRKLIHRDLLFKTVHTAWSRKIVPKSRTPFELVTEATQFFVHGRLQTRYLSEDPILSSVIFMLMNSKRRTPSKGAPLLCATRWLILDSADAGPYCILYVDVYMFTL